MLSSATCRWRHCQHPAGNDAGVALSLRTSPWRSCHHCCCGVGVVVAIRLLLLPTPLGHCRHPDANNTASPCRCCGAGVIAVPELQKLTWCHLGIVAVAALVSSWMLPWLRYHCCCHGAGVLVVLASSWTLPWRCLGIAAVAAPASLRMSPWRCCLCCCQGAAIIAVLASLRTLPWGRWGIIAIAALESLRTLPWHCCHPCRRNVGVFCGAGIIADVTLAPLGHCCHHGTGIIIDVLLALLPTLPLWRWRHRGHCDGAIANVVWAPSPMWRWHCHPCHTGIIAWAVLPLQRGRQSPLLGWGFWGPPQPS